MSASTDDPIELQNYSQNSANLPSDSKHDGTEAKSYPTDVTKEESNSNENENSNESSSPVSNEFERGSSVMKGNFLFRFK